MLIFIVCAKVRENGIFVRSKFKHNSNLRETRLDIYSPIYDLYFIFYILDLYFSDRSSLVTFHIYSTPINISTRNLHRTLIFVAILTCRHEWLPGMHDTLENAGTGFPQVRTVTLNI